MKKYTKVSLVLEFLKGNLHLFVISIFSALAVTGLEMLSPQLIRTTVDSVIGSEPMELPEFLLVLIDSIGGVEYLRSHLWVIAIAIVVIALLSALFRYTRRFRKFRREQEKARILLL